MQRDLFSFERDWYEPLRAIRSLGSQAPSIAHQGELAAARRQHLGQFFTPDAIAAFMWSFVSGWEVNRLIRVLDNSVGSGRLLQYADPERHAVYGVDVHGDVIQQCQKVFEDAGFDCEFRQAGMEDIHPARFDIAIINPPFSIHLESPHLQTLDCTTWGRYGAHTSALSHDYAVHQALEAANIVVALLPITTAESMIAGEQGDRLKRRAAGLFELPADAFKLEGANVRTAVVVFDRYRDRPSDFVRAVVDNLAKPGPDLGLHFEDRSFGEARLRLQKLDDSVPYITRAVTGDKSVKISHDGRRIRLSFACGFNEAMVLNAVLVKRIYSRDGHRLPRGFRYSGQGLLDMETYLVQDDPVTAFGQLLDRIRSVGGEPQLAPGFMEHFLRRMRRSARQAIPLRHVAWTTGAGSRDQVSGTAKETHKVDATRWASPLIKAGDEVHFDREADGRYRYALHGVWYHLSVDELNARFAVDNVSEGWEVVHEGLCARFPDQAAALRSRVKALGVDQWLDWEFQVDDLVETLLKPTGCIVAWEQGCGKSRLALALILVSGVKHGLIVVESRLIEEMLKEISQLPIAADQVKVIESAADLTDLRQINLISYERLRMPVDKAVSARVTYAHRLRRRIGLLVADEGERLANPTSDQSRALWQLSARRRFVLTGSPIPNYPRDAFGLIAFSGGDGTAAQPYGYRVGYLEQNWINSVEYAMRGVDRFRDDFVVLEWVTWQFAESLQDGAKREVPKIGNLHLYRAMLAPHIKRRLVAEPEVSRYIQIEPPQFEVETVDWDRGHLAAYLRAADQFADWYRSSRDDKKACNLVTILARIRAVHFSANYPQFGMEGVEYIGGLTSKQRAIVARMRAIAAEGKQAIVFAENPGVLDLLARELDAHGVQTVPFHGEIPIKRRVADKDKRFLGGLATGLMATKASGRAGYNLPNADYILFYDRSWTWRIEYQAMRRALRWNRNGVLKVVYFHLPGSIDEYQDQMVAHKRDATQAGLDWATPELDDETFLHMDSLLDRFVADLALLATETSVDMRKLLKEAA
ncbi:SNF2-related protein [Caballeronia novacaledonica]|uniref:Methyltransferase domain-containing protein n=1 Tax=Caballeronia novacaledonica TaxID=1544861 RepID=A0AA37MQT0_9BURK|nr:SNF2-related protein [Caballeronia novacaledonica]GJH26866.1 methyltransferase domain-containing protein [Caballeronia novacaledonica]